jgi:hypothetical protein
MSVRSITQSYSIEEELARLQSEKQSFYDNQLKTAQQQLNMQDAKLKNLQSKI